MKQLWILLKLHAGRMLRKPSFLAALLLPLALLLLVGALLPREREATLTVGIFVEEDSALAEAFYDTLLAVETPPVAFVRAESRAQLEELVAATVWECGYVLPSDFSERVKAYDLSEIFTRVSSPASTMQMLSNAAIQGALLDLVADDVAAHYLAGLNVMDKDTFFTLIETEEIRTSEFIAYFDVEALNSTLQPSSETISIANELKAVIALGLFLLFMLAAVQFSEDMRGGFFLRLSPLCGRSTVFLSAPLTLLLLGIIEAILLFALAAFFEPAYAANAFWEFIALLAYLLYLTALAYLLSCTLRLGRAVLSAIPFLLLASLLLTPVFVDLARFAPALYPVSLILPPAMYFRVAEGSVLVLVLMLLLTGLFAVLSRFFLEKRVRIGVESHGM